MLYIMSKTKKNKEVKNKTRKISLENAWKKLSSGKMVIIIYTNGKHKFVKLPLTQKKIYEKYNEFDNDPLIKAVLTSAMSWDFYEKLEKKAKNKSIGQIIKNYKRFFKSQGPMPKDLIDKGMPEMKKVLYIY
jgi:hypothetical protein